jgi:hypothetical protein
MALKTTILFKDGYIREPITDGLHAALGYIEDAYVQAKEGLVAEVDTVTIQEVER